MFLIFIISAGEVKEAAAEKVDEAKDKANEVAATAQEKAEGKYYRFLTNSYLIFVFHMNRR